MSTSIMMNVDTKIQYNKLSAIKGDQEIMAQYTSDYIGIIRTPFTQLQGMPIQPCGAKEVIGEVIVDPQFQEGLKDLDGFSHIYLIYHLHQAAPAKLTVIPFMDTVPRGIFATRSPVRPSQLGLSIVELLSVEENRLQIRGVDILDGTPLLDIKPFIKAFDCPEEAASGWMTAERKEVAERKSDHRFIK